ncbi:MAG: hypothetical protein ACT4P7_21505 [Gemmatimonadaceae bacterium]
MRQYVLVSGLFLALVTCGQLLRLGFRAQVIVAGVEIPLWASGIATVIAGTLAVWAFRLRAARDSGPAV